MSVARSGKNNPQWGKRLSDEHKAGISASLKGRVVSKETRLKIGTKNKLNYANGGTFKGKHHTEETKKRMSEAQSGKKSFNYGKKLSAETKAKISSALKGRCPTKETRKLLSERQRGEKNHNYGKKLSAETKAKMSASHKKWITLNSKTRSL